MGQEGSQRSNINEDRAPRQVWWKDCFVVGLMGHLWERGPPLDLDILLFVGRSVKGGRLEVCEEGERTGEQAKHRCTGPVSRDGAASGLVDLCGCGWQSV